MVLSHKSGNRVKIISSKPSPRNSPVKKASRKDRHHDYTSSDGSPERRARSRYSQDKRSKHLKNASSKDDSPRRRITEESRLRKLQAGKDKGDLKIDKMKKRLNKLQKLTGRAGQSSTRKEHGTEQSERAKAANSSIVDSKGSYHHRKLESP